MTESKNTKDKPVRPKLTLSRNVNLTDISSRLNALADKANIANKAKVSNSKSISKIEKDQQKRERLITKTGVKNDTIESIKSKDEGIQKTIKQVESKIIDLSKKEDKIFKEQKNQNKQKKQQETKKKEHKQEKIKEEPKENKTISFKGMLSKLRQFHPITFPSDETKIVALKVGINKDIKENLELMKKLCTSITYLGKFLKWYTSSKNYRTITQVEGNFRYDLTGQVVGVVTKEQAEDIRNRIQNSTDNNSNQH